MRREIRVEQIRDEASISDQTELTRMVRLEQSRFKESGEKTQQIGVEQEHHGEREGPLNLTAQ